MPDTEKATQANLMSATHAVTTKLSQEIDWFSVSFTWQGTKSGRVSYIKTYWPAGGGRGQNPENTAQGHSGQNAIRPKGG